MATTDILNDPEFNARVFALIKEIEAERKQKQQQEYLLNKNRPVVYVSNTDALELAPQILCILTQELSLYQQHGGVIVRHRDNGKGQIEVLDKKKLRAEITSHIEFRKSPANDVKTRLAEDAIDYLLDSDRDPALPQFREFRYHAHAPFFAADGTLVYEEGYNAATRTILTLSPDLVGMKPIPSEPTAEHVKMASDFLCKEVLGDFVFSPLEASRSHMLAALITPFVRPLINGLVPQIGISAPVHGSGKSLLAKLVALVATGQHQPMMAAKTNHDEQRKTITGILESGQQIAVWDNIKVGDVVGGSPLATLLTSDIWADRILQTNNVPALPNRCQWVVTGNRLQFTGELARRTIVVQIQRKEDRVYSHSPLEDWVLQNRVKIIRAILVLVQHWLVTGRVAFEARCKPTFENFSRVVGGILQAANLEQGFLTETKNIGGNDTEMIGANVFANDDEPVDSMEADPDALMREFVPKWALSPGYNWHTATQLFEYAPRSWQGKIITAPKEVGQRRQFSMYLAKHKGRVFGEYRIEVKSVSGEENKYRVVPIKEFN